MDSPPRHIYQPIVYFLLFKVGITSILSNSVLFVFRHGFRVEDYCLVIYYDVGSIPKGAIARPGEDSFLLRFIFISFIS
jgi:hypothetical protein